MCLMSCEPEEKIAIIHTKKLDNHPSTILSLSLPESPPKTRIYLSCLEDRDQNSVSAIRGVSQKSAALFALFMRIKSVLKALAPGPKL